MLFAATDFGVGETAVSCDDNDDGSYRRPPPPVQGLLESALCYYRLWHGTDLQLSETATNITTKSIDPTGKWIKTEETEEKECDHST